MFGQSNAKPGEFQCDTLISNKTTLVGNIHFSGGLHIDGQVKGNLIAEDGSNAVVRISEQGRVEGEIRSPRAIVNGHIEGNLFVDQHIELAEKAKVDGDIHYTAIQMVMGAQVNGRLVHEARMETKSKRTKDAAKATSNIESLAAKATVNASSSQKSTGQASTAQASTASKAQDRAKMAELSKG